MSHMKLVNFILSVLLLIIFLIMVIVVKIPIEDGMSESIADSYYNMIRYHIYNYNLEQWLLFIICSIGLLINMISPLFLLIIVLFNKRIRLLFLILPVFGVLPLLIHFIYAVVNIFFPYLILFPTLVILIIAQLIFNIKYNKGTTI
ncbi:hypothetical protein KHQ81_02940 [Mycoplasmatota bacterium]|nr:hypothetical protein KHQ81_02940 [Mycoplasmatota bacterium]